MGVFQLHQYLIYDWTHDWLYDGWLIGAAISNTNGDCQLHGCANLVEPSL